MKNFVKRMVEQHANVVAMLDKYNKFMNNAIKDNKTNKVTAANICLIVRDLKNLAKDFETCLANEGVHFSPDGTYYEKIAKINEIIDEQQ